MFVDVQKAKISYSDTGEGEPALFLHGIPDSGGVWNDVTHTVSSAYRCLVPDLPGFGRSGIPAEFQVSLEGMAEFVDAFLVAVGIGEPVHLVVHDIGGPFGLAWAVRNPDKVKSITIMNTVFQSEYRWHRYGRICRTPVLGELLQVLTSRSGLARSILANWGSAKPSNEYLSATYSKFTRPVRKMVLRIYRGLDPVIFHDWDTRLRALTATVPSLVLWGDRDTYIDSQYAYRFGAQSVRRFPDGGHWLMVEAPDVVARNLLEHFSGTPPVPKEKSNAAAVAIERRDAEASQELLGHIDAR
ncbi:MAG: alpha/beta hydrolase [Herminiimonas sp.]|nr:alpha/beta hydrolase [Herminiimonas sp.]MDB5852918.1 alpha/beta hydrolase [Herminiimonas sp.]